MSPVEKAIHRRNEWAWRFWDACYDAWFEKANELGGEINMTPADVDKAMSAMLERGDWKPEYPVT